MSNFINKTFNKLVGSSSSSSNSSSGQSSKSTISNINQNLITQQQLIQNQDTQLTLAHLRKVFYEYLHPKMS
jgi:hypothetical protein